MDSVKKGINKRGENKWFVIVFSCLCVMIVGLTIGIVTVNTIRSNNGEGEPVSSALSEEGVKIIDASNTCGEIREQFVNNSYSYESAVNDMSEALNNSNDATFKVSLATCYANFVSTYNGDLDAAISILSSVEDNINDVEPGVAVRFYSAAINIAEQNNNDVLLKQYEEKLNGYNQYGGEANNEG